MTGSDHLGDSALPRPEDVGSVGQEALRLLRALSTQQTSQSPAPADGESASAAAESAEHSCPNGWCPVCGVVAFVRDNPEAVAQVTDSAMAMVRSLRDLYDAAVNPKDHLS